MSTPQTTFNESINKKEIQNYPFSKTCIKSDYFIDDIQKSINKFCGCESCTMEILNKNQIGVKKL